MKTNPKATDYRVGEERLAGGYGMKVAKQDAEALLRRSVMTCLLWENIAYVNGADVAKTIASLIPQVDPKIVFDIAVEARMVQKLRHVPLFIAREMAKLPDHKKYVGELLPKIIQRADEIAEFMAIYWKDGRQPISAQVKKGLAASFDKFNEYDFQKYNRDTAIKLRDVMFMVHPNPGAKSELFAKIANDTMETPDTWEVAISATKDKQAEWTRLVSERKLGALAFLRNLRNMEQAGVADKVIRDGFSALNTKWVLPINFFAAAQNNPKWSREIETAMLSCLASAPKLTGKTVFIVDVSGSMGCSISSKSTMSRMDVACAMALIASECCEQIAVYATAGSDGRYTHATELVKPYRGFALIEEIKKLKNKLGGGGIFTRQCLEYIKEHEKDVDRIIIFSDSQDCDYSEKRLPAPFGKNNYIVDVSNEKHGIKYDGVWTAEISGWSEHFLDFIFASEGLEIKSEE